MNFIDHSGLEGEHAFLSASKYHWTNYSEEKLVQAYSKYQAAQKGTILHDYACQSISLGFKLSKSRQTVNMYVNDAIGYRMTPEQVLYYSDNCFGTADAISFRRNKLRIHDLKTGTSPVSMRQLEVYAALFCLEYEKDPHAIEMELRIYQSAEVMVYTPDPDDIQAIMDKIVAFDKKIEELKSEE